MEESQLKTLEEFQALFGNYSYVVTAKVGDPVYGKAKARLIWAAQTAQATFNLGLKSLLIASVDRLPYKVESPQNVDAVRRNLQELYNIKADFDIMLLYPPVGEVKERPAGHYELSYEIPRYVFPRTSVVHTRDPKLVQRCVAAKIPFLYEDHDEDHNLSPEIDIRLFDSPLCKGIVAITPNVAERLKMTLTTVGASKLLICDSGVNSAAFDKQIDKSVRWRRFLLKEENRKKLVVYSGGMQKERGIGDILQVAIRHPDIMFAFAGGTDRDINLWYDYTKMKRINNVKFLGYLPQSEACSLQQSADVLLSTRANDYRATITSPLKFFEYLASETPIVSSKINALQNLDTEGLAVSWYEAGDLIELEKKILTTFQKFPRDGKCFSQNSNFARKFTWEERQKKILKQILDMK